MEKLFRDVLDKDEKIIAVIKPNKRRYWKTLAMPFGIPLFWPHLIIMLVLTLFTLPFFFANGYKNLYYAYTNKRLITRSGWIGVKYESLEYKDITSTSIEVGFLDKGCKTGSLSFSSPSVHAGEPMKFAYINNPFDCMKAIKEEMSKHSTT